ncbi:MAG: sugar phosphate isomerase/epimerase family protein [Terriglobia bacterium]
MIHQFPTLAVNTVTYLPFSLDEALQGISAAGFNSVEIAAIPGVCEHISLEMDKGDLSDLRMKLATFGLRLCSLSSHSDLTSRQGVDLAKKAIELASGLDVPIVNTAVGGPSNEDEDESLFLENIPAVADFAQRHHVVLALEIHGTLTGTGEKTIKLVRKVRHPHVKINYDTGNGLYYAGTPPYEDLVLTLPELAHVHLKDKVGGKRIWNFPPPGEGEIDFHRIIKILEDSAYSGPVSLEIEFSDKGWPGLDEVNAAVAKTRQYLTGILNTINP